MQGPDLQVRKPPAEALKVAHILQLVSYEQECAH